MPKVPQAANVPNPEASVEEAPKPLAPPVRKPAKRIDYNQAPAPDATPVEPPPAKPVRTIKMDGGSVRYDY